MIKIPARYATVEFEQVPLKIRNSLTELPNNRNSVYIHGAVGTGKTHIAYALAKEHERLTGWTRFWNVTELMHEIKADFNREFEDKKNHDVALLNFNGLLVLDDIGAEKATDFVAETLYMIINNRYNHMWPTVFTSNLPIQALASRIGDRTASRIVEMCNIFELGGSDRRLK